MSYRSLAIISGLVFAFMFSLLSSTDAAFGSFVGPGCNERVQVALSYDGSKVAFESNEGSKIAENFTLFAVDSDGSNFARIGPVASIDDVVAMSDNGSKVAFVSDVNGTNQVFVSYTNESRPMQLTKYGENKTVVAISPDGSKIVFATHPDHIGAVINFYLVYTDDSAIKQLTNDSYDKAWPSVSHDFSTLVYDEYVNRTFYAIGSVHTDGTDNHYVIKGNYSLFSHLPNISEDGSKIVFSTARDGRNSTIVHLYTINTDGSSLTQLFPGVFNGTDFTISADGSTVVFDGGGLSIIHSDGTGYFDFANPPYFAASYPQLSSNGSRIIFFNFGSGEPSLGNTYSAYTNSSLNDRPWTANLITNQTLAFWQTRIFPDGSKILYSADSSRTSGINATDQVYVSDFNGKNARSIVDNSHFKREPMCNVFEMQEEQSSRNGNFASSGNGQFSQDFGFAGEAIIAIGSIAAVAITLVYFIGRKRR